MKKIYLIGIMIVIVIISIYIFSSIIDYGDNSNNIGDSGSANIAVSDEFERIKENFKSNYSAIISIPKEYYVRPEFYYSQEIIDIFKNQAQQSMYGYGAYPGEVSYNVFDFKKGQHLDVYTFVHSAPGVNTYQGMRLLLRSPDDLLFETYVDPSDILLQPINISSSENPQNWTYIIKMTIVSREDIPKGKYEFKLDIESPSQEKRSEYYDIVQNMNGMYVENSPFQPSKFFDFILYVY